MFLAREQNAPKPKFSEQIFGYSAESTKLDRPHCKQLRSSTSQLSEGRRLINPPPPWKRREAGQFVILAFSIVLQYTQDFHFLLQDARTPEGFRKGVFEGVSEGVSEGFLNGFRRGQPRTPSKTLLKPFKNPSETPSKTPSEPFRGPGVL